MGYTVFMKGDGLTIEFIDIYNYYGYNVVLCSYLLYVLSEKRLNYQ